MKCDECKRIMNYCFYIADDQWLKANNGTKEGYLCAHCLLDRLGGLDWRIIIWDKPKRNEELVKALERVIKYANQHINSPRFLGSGLISARTIRDTLQEELKRAKENAKEGAEIG